MTDLYPRKYIHGTVTTCSKLAAAAAARNQAPSPGPTSHWHESQAASLPVVSPIRVAGTSPSPESRELEIIYYVPVTMMSQVPSRAAGSPIKVTPGPQDPSRCC
jgi:hypothetical protein